MLNGCLALSPRRLIPIVLLAGLITMASSRPVDPSWKLVKNKDSIQVYNRPAAGVSMNEFMGVGRDAIRVEIAYQTLIDLPAYPDWVDYLLESKIISREGLDNMLVYQRYDLPWPFADRDIVARVLLRRDYAKGEMSAVMTAENHPEIASPSGCVRIPRMEGSVGLRYISREITEGYYSELLELGGSIPDWLENLFCREIPYIILLRLRAECRKPKYAAAAESSAEKDGIEQAIREGLLPP